MTLSRRLFLLSGAATLGSTALAQAPETSPRPVARSDAPTLQRSNSESIVRKAGLSGVAAFTLVNLKTGKIEEAFNETELLPPASVTKAMTAAFALNTLGPDYTFKTQLLMTGEIVDGHLNGDLILLGSGDPTLYTDDIVDFSNALAALGIWDIRGKFIVDDGGFPLLRQIDPLQPPQVDYNPSVSGLNLNLNRIRFDWRRLSNGTYDVDMRASGEEYRPVINFSRMVPKDRSTPKYTHRRHGDGEMWTVKRGMLSKKGGRWLPTRIPRMYTGEALRSVARAMGIIVPRPEIGTKPDVTRQIAVATSASLNEIAQVMLKKSTNLTAEVLGFAASGQPDLATSTDALSEFTRSNGMFGSFVDHSGLGEASQTSALGLANFMLTQKDTGLREILKPINLKSTSDVVFNDVDLKAKTGSLNFVSTLSGYIKRGDNDYGFAIQTADLAARAKIKREDRERPAGGASWAKRSRRLQYALLRNWIA